VRRRYSCPRDPSIVPADRRGAGRGLRHSPPQSRDGRSRGGQRGWFRDAPGLTRLVRSTLVTHRGEVVNARVREFFAMPDLANQKQAP